MKKVDDLEEKSILANVKYKSVKKIIIIIVLLVVAAGAASFYAYFKSGEESVAQVDSFAECAAAGFTIQESFPAQCQTPDGRIFVQNIGNSMEKQNLITLSSPSADTLVTSPLKVTGEARGNWYFEASFPVRLVDSAGNELGRVPAQAQGEWMTTDFVPYEATLAFATSSTATGTLILEKDNPSGLPQNADSMEVPVHFSL